MASNLPHYVASAQPVPLANRVPWYKSTAQTYAGIMLWFVFWQSVPASGAPGTGGILAQGLGTALLGVIVAALICHFASYLAPGLMGMKTGLPLAVVGTSTYGVQGGFLMPGFFMGVLQFGWLAVNSYFSAVLLAGLAGYNEGTPVQLGIGVVWAIVAAFVGLKGIQYVAKVATYLPIIPLVILLVLAGKTMSGVGNFKPEMLAGGAEVVGLSSLDVAPVRHRQHRRLLCHGRGGRSGYCFEQPRQQGRSTGRLDWRRRGDHLHRLPGAADRGRSLWQWDDDRQGRDARSDQADGHDHGARCDETLLAPVGRRRFPTGLLQFADRGQQHEEHPAEGQPVPLRRHWHGRVDCLGPVRPGRQCGSDVRHHRCIRSARSAVR